MNDDLKAYVDGELPPDAAERLRERMEADPALALQGEEFRRLSAALRALPEPMPVGQAATLEALARRRPIWRGWAVALAGCAAVLAVVSTLPSRAVPGPTVQQAVFDHSLNRAPQERGPANEAPSPDDAQAGETKAAAPAMSKRTWLDEKEPPRLRDGSRRRVEPRRTKVRGPKAG